MKETADVSQALLPLSILERTPSQGVPKPFIFVSAAFAPPFLKRYLTTKQAVEKVIENISWRFGFGAYVRTRTLF